MTQQHPNDNALVPVAKREPELCYEPEKTACEQRLQFLISAIESFRGILLTEALEKHSQAISRADDSLAQAIACLRQHERYDAIYHHSVSNAMQRSVQQFHGTEAGSNDDADGENWAMRAQQIFDEIAKSPIKDADYQATLRRAGYLYLAASELEGTLRLDAIEQAKNELRVAVTYEDFGNAAVSDDLHISIDNPDVC